MLFLTESPQMTELTSNVSVQSVPLRQGPAATDSTREEARLREVSQSLEATFLSEMLKHTGLDKMSEEFGGGIGAEQFASLLRDEQAKIMAETGGIGLAEHIFNALKERMNG